jgi:hypothetical protein
VTKRIEPRNPSPPPPPTPAWPAGIPGLDVAERALRSALDASAPPDPAIGGVATRVAGELSEIEGKALRGAPLQVDSSPLRRAAAMRVRVGAALASAPPPGARADGDAVAALLAEIDDLLSDVNAVAASGSMELAAALAACRGALVKEAIDFSEVAQRYAVEAGLELQERSAAGLGASGAYGAYGAPAAGARPGATRRLLLFAVATVVAGALAWAGCHLAGR